MRRRSHLRHDFSWIKDLLLAIGVVLAVFFVLMSIYPPTYVFRFTRIDLPAPSTSI